MYSGLIVRERDKSTVYSAGGGAFSTCVPLLKGTTYWEEGKILSWGMSDDMTDLPRENRIRNPI